MFFWILAVTHAVPAHSGILGIFGDDNRTHFVANQMEGPLRNVGWLKMQYMLPEGTAEATCTGFLITRQLVLTAAHCLWPPDIKARPTKISFLLRYNGSIVPYQQQFTARTTLIPSAWEHKQDLSYDFAALVLDRRSLETGIPLATYTEAELDQQTTLQSLQIIGYPGSKSGRLFVAPSKEYGIDSKNRLIVHKGDIEPGESGGPVLFQQKAIGVHSFMSADYNASVALEARNMAIVRAWMRQYP